MAFHSDGPYATGYMGICSGDSRLFYATTVALRNWTASNGGSASTTYWAADREGTTQGLGAAVNLYNLDSWNYDCDSQNPIQIDTEYLPGSAELAHVDHIGCNNQADSCLMYLNTAQPFYFQAGAPPYNDYTLQGTIAHEMGHWIGMDHSGVNNSCTNEPQADGGDGCGFYSVDDAHHSVMQPLNYLGDATDVSYGCDDIQGFLQARFGYYQNALANPSFECGGGPDNPGLCWHYRSGTNGGSATDYDVAPGAESYNWWVEFNGYNSSLQQDMWLHGPTTNFQHIRFWLRDRSSTTWVPAVIAVWNLDTYQVISNTSFSVPPDNTWHYYNVYNVTIPNDTPIRIELYNDSYINLDADSGEMGPLGP